MTSIALPQRAHGAPTTRTNAVAEAIAHAAHYLPAQGPITCFIHHNTLHALEDLPFDQAVVEGAEIFGCHPYLSEDEFRAKLASERIRQCDLEAALLEELGPRAEELLGCLGTRFELRNTMLTHPLPMGSAAEVRWWMAETDALRRFREDVPDGVRERMIRETRHWAMRDLQGSTSALGDEAGKRHFQQIVERLDQPAGDGWPDSLWEACCLRLLWMSCQEGVRRAAPPPPARRRHLRHRDILLDLTGQDSDELVHSVLIPLCAAFLDQGFSPWPVERERGLFHIFLDLYGLSVAPPNRWMRGLREEIERVRNEHAIPLASICESLDALGIDEPEWGDFLVQTLLALRGFAGMAWYMESNGDRVAHPLPDGSLVEFLAVRLLLERCAVAHIAAKSAGYSGSLAALRGSLGEGDSSQGMSLDQRTFLAFQVAQLRGWTPESLYGLSRQEWSEVVGEMEGFTRLERRRIYHAAFERGFRVQSLDAILSHNQQACQATSARSELANATSLPAAESQSAGRPFKSGSQAVPSAPSFQLVTCIDEREESFRRHTEEIEAECETFGAAGFFAVAMYYRGAADAHYAPLCPVIIKPRHFVREDVAVGYERSDSQRRKHRRALGAFTRRIHLGSRTFAGGWFAAVFGSLASLPLVMRILFPRTTARFRRALGGFVRTPGVTQLQLERVREAPGPDDGHLGYSKSEMATIVERLLRDIGLTSNFSRLVVVAGHGSSSLNNPHESAHDCGACGGGRGGPNARAFAHMANDPRIRQWLAKNAALVIPDSTHFLGAYHNTCDDSIVYFDLERLPTTHRADFERASAALDEARRRNAHERCRRFESAPFTLAYDAALRHVEGRAEDLSQVRPEYGHATNALCLVGRRAWSRGLFLDRRGFLHSYDPTQDDADHGVLTRILQAVIPVCAGISLEYYFSSVDPNGYGCGTKLPHNITSLVGVMNGAASDLLPGLPWQMVEIHEPMRLLFVIEAAPETLERIMDRNAGIARLVRGGWVQVATYDPASNAVQLYADGAFRPHAPTRGNLPATACSADWYRGWREHLGFAAVHGPESA